MTTSYILIFTFTIFIASIIPGPSMLLALSHGIKYGTKRTIISALGNVLVTLVQASVSIAGLGTILSTSNNIFIIIKWLGSAYLILLGFKMLISKNSPLELNKVENAIYTDSNKKLFIQSVLVTASNPKAILFFTAIFPQFINTDSTFIYQSIVLVAIICSVAFVCFMIYSIFGHKICSILNKKKFSKILDKAFGFTFIGAGVGIATTS